MIQTKLITVLAFLRSNEQRCRALKKRAEYKQLSNYYPELRRSVQALERLCHDGQRYLPHLKHLSNATLSDILQVAEKSLKTLDTLEQQLELLAGEGAV